MPSLRLRQPKSHNVSHATFIQAVVVIILIIINELLSGLSSCLSADKTDCGTNSVLGVVLVILAIIWFGFLSAMAYAAWVRRTISLIVIFILLEIIVAIIGLLMLVSHGSIIGTITGLLVLLTTLWVLYMSYFLLRLRGKPLEPIQGRSRSKLNQK